MFDRFVFFFFKQKTAYEERSRDWSSDVCSADLWFGCILRGDVNRIRVGAGSNLQDGTVVHGNHDRAGDYRETGGGMPTVIGDNVVVGHQAMLHACTLEDGAFVGMAAVVMDQAVVEPRAMVAAGALEIGRAHV